MGRHDKYQQFEFADTTPRRTRSIPWRWLIAVTLVAAAAGWLWKFEQPRVREVLKGTPLEAPSAPASTQAYKWRDADGTWNITDRPPPGGIEYEVLR